MTTSIFRLVAIIAVFFIAVLTLSMDSDSLLPFLLSKVATFALFYASYTLCERWSNDPLIKKIINQTNVD